MHPSPNQDLGPHPDFPECRVAFDESAGFFRTVPYPSEAALEAFYTREYRAIRQESPTDEYVNFMRHRAKAQADFILAHSGRTHFDRVIDIGCGCGELLNALQPYADELHGYETDPVMAGHAMEHCSSPTIHVHNQHFTSESSESRFDLIAMSHVLEHVPDPIWFLTKLRVHSLGNQAVLFIEVPNDPPYRVEKQVAWKLRGYGHINHFTSETLMKAVKISGFRVISNVECGIMDRKQIYELKPRGRIAAALKRRFKKQFHQKSSSPDYSQTLDNKDGLYLLLVCTPN